MHLHEYQAKQLFRRAGIAVPDGVHLTQLESLAGLPDKLGGDAWVVKAQIHAGGRGQAGGVKLVRDVKALEVAAKSLLGSSLATQQTAGKALPVNGVLVETLTDIERELYLGLLVDRASESVAVITSADGGMDIETVAEQTPDRVLSLSIPQASGYMPYMGRRLAFALGLSGAGVKAFAALLKSLYELFVECDASLIEINPLVVTSSGDLVALDAKMNLDSNALYRQVALRDWRDETQEDPREVRAAEQQLNYISLDGSIGCMVNGAGLAMATMDLIQLKGGAPANFLDVGGGATAERVAEAFKIILSDEAVKAVLVNIFGGIVRCDLIADGIIQAIQTVDVSVPVVVRLEGTNAEQGRETLANSGLNITPASGLTEAAERAVALAGGAA